MLRIRAQHLYRKAPRGHMVDVVRSLCGINAQSAPAMLLSLRARVEGLVAADVALAIGRGRLVRTWAMRGTMHLLAPDDLGWMVSLLGPGIIARGGRRRRELGLTDEVLAKSLAALPGILKDGPLARGELVDGLAGRGIVLEAGQAPYHLIAYAALKGLLRMGPDRPDGGPTYCLTDAGMGGQKTFERGEALAGLARRYLRGYGPAAPEDLAAWSGLSRADARKGLELAGEKEALEELAIEGHTLWSPAFPPGAGPIGGQAVRLLPAFDVYILGYFDREYVVPGKYRREVYHGGQTVPVVLVDGLAAGVWRYERRGQKMDVKIKLFKPLGERAKGLIGGEVEDIGRFFGVSASLFYI